MNDEHCSCNKQFFGIVINSLYTDFSCTTVVWRMMLARHVNQNKCIILMSLLRNVARTILKIVTYAFYSTSKTSLSSVWHRFKAALDDCWRESKAAAATMAAKIQPWYFVHFFLADVIQLNAEGGIPC